MACKWLQAFGAVAMLAGLTVPASAQPSLMQCFAAANNPLLRAEDYTASAGDIFIECQGGVPTAPGASIPKATITVFVTNTTITSKLTQTTDDPNWNEALLIMDEAGATTSSNGLMNCGSATAPFETTPNDLTCNITSANGDGTGDYTGAPGRPNVFQGRVVNGSSGQAIQFIGVPIDPPGPCPAPSLLGYTPPCYVLPTRVMRITNLRVNAAALNVYLSNSFSLVTINTVVSVSGTNFADNQTFGTQNGTVRPGLLVTSSTPQAARLTGAAAFLQCNATPGYATDSILLTEGFPTAFKVRNFAQIIANGNAPPGGYQSYSWNGGTSITDGDISQNVPNALYLYNTETGVTYDPADPVPATNPPAGTSSNGTAPTGTAFNSLTDDTGIASAGEVSRGTRIAVRFSGIPVGSNPSVPLAANLQTRAFSSEIDTGTLVLVCGTDSSGAGGTTASCSNSAAIPGTSPLSVSAAGNAVAIYEVAFEDPTALEFAEVVVYVNPTVNLSANPPVGGTPQLNQTATAVATFAPLYASNVGAGLAQLTSSKLIAASPNSVPSIPASAPIPRFRDDVTGGIPVALFAYAPCTQPIIPPPDTSTQGNWKGVYGTDGYIIANDSNKPPAYLTVPSGDPFTGASTYTWVASTTEGRALQKGSAADRIASTFYARDSFTIDLPFSDTLLHQVALYLLDLDTTERAETITILDPVTNAVVGSQSFSNFHNGTWALFNIQGPARIRVSRTAGLNAVVSGVFFKTLSSVPPPTVSIISPTSVGWVAGTQVLSATAAAANVPGTSIVSVQFQLDGNNLGAPVTSGPPYTLSWVSATASNGDHTLVAVATDGFGQTTSSAPVTFKVMNILFGYATFVKNDATTQGTWKGHYGADGQIIALDSNSPPAYAAASFQGAQLFQWAVTGDQRALQEANSTTLRVASAYYGNPSFSMDLPLTDGQFHQVALYFMDWDGGGRSETVTIRDAETQTLLDTRQVTSFAGGQYLVWNLTGHVTIQFTMNSGANAVLNGVFLAPVAP